MRTCDNVSHRLPSKQYRFFKKNPSVLLPCNPMGLHGNSTEGFLLKKLHCLVCSSICLGCLVLYWAFFSQVGSICLEVYHIRAYFSQAGSFTALHTRLYSDPSRGIFLYAGLALSLSLLVIINHSNDWSLAEVSVPEMTPPSASP